MLHNSTKPNISRLRRPRRTGRWLAGVFSVFFLGVSSLVVGQERVAQEQTIKAAYLLKFPAYVTWPRSAFNSATSPLVIGVLNGGAVGDLMARRAPKATVTGRKVVVRRFNSMDDYRPCHVLFVPATTSMSTQTAAIASTSHVPVLVVGERTGFATAGGVVNFYIDANNTIGFEINRDATLQRGLRIDARLLELAKVVRTRPPENN